MCVSVISFSLLFFLVCLTEIPRFLYLDRRIMKFMILHTIKSIFQSLHQPRWEIQSILEGKLGNWYHYLSSLLWSLSRLGSQIIVARDVSDLTSRGQWYGFCLTSGQQPYDPCGQAPYWALFCFSMPVASKLWCSLRSTTESTRKASRQAGIQSGNWSETAALIASFGLYLIFVMKETKRNRKRRH